MTDAMQMLVSSEMAQRIDDSSSTDARRVREPQESLMPWVETVMCEGQRLQGLQRVGGIGAKGLWA